MGGVLVLAVFGAMAEVASLGAVVPFLALLVNANAFQSNPTIAQALKLFDLQSANLLFVMAAAFGLLVVVAAIIRVFLLYVSNRFVFEFGADLSGQGYRRTMFQPYSYHVSHNSAEIIAGINRVNKVVTGVMNPLMQGVVSLIVSIAILLVLFRIDFPTAAAAMFGFTALYFFASFSTRSKLRSNSVLITQNEGRRIKATQEALGGIRDLIIDNAQGVYVDKFVRLSRETAKAQGYSVFLSSSPKYFIEATGMVLIVTLACWLSMRPEGLAGAIPILGALAVGAQKLFPQMQQIYNAWNAVNSNAAQLEDMLGRLSLTVPYESTRQPNKKRGHLLGENSDTVIVLKDVSFSYVCGGECVLSDIVLSIPRGGCVGFVGKTGSGKSTLIDLVLGLLQPTSGRILVDGVVLDESSIRSWHECVAHVPQTIYLVDASIAENIAFGSPEGAQLDFDRIRQAAIRAQISDFIDALPNGYATQVGERGVRLSGGQRQRIGLARAFFKKASVLVFDEATSALDDHTEAEVMKTINALGSDVTVLMIAHRLSTLSNCNTIVRMDAGRIVQIGNFSEVIGDSDEIAPRLLS